MSKTDWTLRYLNDDGSELDQKKGLFRGNFFKRIDCSCTALWDAITPEYEVPPWVSLLLDAEQVLPEVGPSVVLGATALEIFISSILNPLATDSSIQPELWGWINSRNQWMANPSVAEQYDTLLGVLLGFSLKEDNDLWKAFSNLKKARNSFVHEGVAKVGGKPLSEDDVKILLENANNGYPPRGQMFCPPFFSPF